MVRGLDIAVTAVSGTYQCAEIIRIAFGLGNAPASRVQASAYRPPSAFIGLPCPKKIAGARGMNSLILRRWAVRPAGASPYAKPGKT